jgi:hypothetical protein
MGITGRNIIIQSKFYGSLRYWLYSMLMPKQIIEALEQDVGTILWKRTPALTADERGTSTPFHRHMIRPVSYRKQRQGGAGAMHWISHTHAFYAQTIIKYLNPRRAPWKHVADHWLGKRHHIGRAFFLTHAGTLPEIANNLPPQLTYLRQCVKSFQALNLQRDLLHYGPEVQAEPLFGNPRFTISLPPQSIDTWQRDLKCITVGDLIDTDTDTFYTPAQWSACFHDEAPVSVYGSPAHGTYCDNRERELPIILAAIPAAILSTIKSCDFNDHEYFALISHPPNAPPHILHYVKRDHLGILHEEWLDLSNYLSYAQLSQLTALLATWPLGRDFTLVVTSGRLPNPRVLHEVTCSHTP